MKFGCCVNMLSNEEDTIGRRYIRLLAESGYDFVELPLAQVMELSDHDFMNLLEELRNTGLPCECCNNFFPGGIRLTGENASPDRIEGYVGKAMQYASSLGTKVIVFGSSEAKNVPEGFSQDKAFEQIVSALKIMDRYAVQYGIIIAIEPLNHNESNIILNLSDYNKLKAAFDFRNIKLLVDYYHFVKENDRAELLVSLMKDVVHVHFADVEKRAYPISMKQEYRQFIDLLLYSGYRGGMSVEAYSNNPHVDIVNYIRLFSGYIGAGQLT